MLFDVKTVNALLDIDESYKVPERMLQLMAEQVPGTSTYVQYADEHYKLTTTLKKSTKALPTGSQAIS